MAYRKSDFIYNREVTKTGLASYEDVYSIIRDNVDNESEFYEIEPATVVQVYIEPKDLPFIGGVPDYSLYGTIKAKFLYSQSGDDQIAEFIKPLSPHIVVYPIVGEVVNVARYGGQLFYYSPLNLQNNVNMNRTGEVTPDGTVKLNITKYNRTLASKKGDININGRFGHGMKFSSNEDYRFPTIKITNGQNNDERKFQNKSFPHVQNINLDGSSITLSSGELNTENDILIPAADSSWWPVKWKSSISGNVIMLNSDSLVFNAKGDKGDVHLFANRNISLASNYSITLETGKDGVINLGDADTNNPILKGDQTADLFKKIFSTLFDFSSTVASSRGVSEINDAAFKLSEELLLMEKNTLPKIFSKTVFVVEEKD